ncbi:hypothetical protein Taro_002663 [Colocasia esculenta]|uniref:Uncharacterized protein n=1 Tax=Colocasia esculenta TaxID=4460 RepID=A0A843TH65_COLES|nr:hypothetical protein [Colocasia esculenta]
MELWETKRRSFGRGEQGEKTWSKEGFSIFVIKLGFSLLQRKIVSFGTSTTLIVGVTSRVFRIPVDPGLEGLVANVGVQVCDVDCVLAAMVLPLTWLTRALFFPHSLPSPSPTFTLEPLHEFRWSTGVRGAAVVRVVAANQAGNDELERGVCGVFLGFRRDSRFFGSSIAFLSVVVRRLFRNASLVGYPRFFVSQAHVFVVLGVCPGVVLVGLHSCLTCSRGAAVGPFVRDCEAERLLLCCVVRVGYWPDQPVSRFDSFEVCPGVGIVVTMVVACGVPEWWHSFGFGLTRALFFPHSLPSSLPTFTLEPLHEFRWSTGVRGAAVVRVVAANQAGNDELERGVRGAFLGFRRDSRFFGSSIAFLRAILCVLAGSAVKILTSTSVDAEFFVGRLTTSMGLLRSVYRLCTCEISQGFDVVEVSRFDSFEVCPGVGTVVTMVVACGVPEWWHNFGYG